MPIADHIQRIKDKAMQEVQIGEYLLWYEDPLNWGIGKVTYYHPDGGVYGIDTVYDGLRSLGEPIIVMDTFVIGKVSPESLEMLLANKKI